jgi:hypothetical protein
MASRFFCITTFLILALPACGGDDADGSASASGSGGSTQGAGGSGGAPGDESLEATCQALCDCNCGPAYTSAEDCVAKLGAQRPAHEMAGCGAEWDALIECQGGGECQNGMFVTDCPSETQAANDCLTT